jgi:hypothetical protein
MSKHVVDTLIARAKAIMLDEFLEDFEKRKAVGDLIHEAGASCAPASVAIVTRKFLITDQEIQVEEFNRWFSTVEKAEAWVAEQPEPEEYDVDLAAEGEG